MNATLPMVPTATAPVARGPLSRALLDALGEGEQCVGIVELAEQAVEAAVDLLHDDDVQLSLFILYASAYGSIPEFDARREWDPQLIEVRRP
ncbi:hypothetical protein [Microbacterium panaciterrae]|uniref:Uncharacterized protein n=1 Tax=Microbacterium panaciterrae TaxID=985759 RepID=A0ABP8P8Y1_9MICO